MRETWTGTRRLLTVVLHLTAREFRIRYQSALLGWLWALIPPLVRVAVLAAVFSVLLPFQGPDYIAELAIGVLAWNWFAAGVFSATSSAVDRRDLLTQPALPRQAVPVVSVLTDAFDYFAGLPILLLVVVLDTGRLPPTAIVLPLLLVLQGSLMLGIGMAASVADVRWRDTRLLVGLLLGVGIYLTPVFYTGRALGDELQGLLTWNPMGVLLEAQRDVLVRGVLPDLSLLAGICALSLTVLVGGWALHRRSAPTFLDDL